MTLRGPDPPVHSHRGAPAAANERVSGHYRRDSGHRYFLYQVQGAEIKAELNARKFRPHVRPDDALVDFGCGPGLTLARLVARERVGVEVNPHNREHAARSGIRTVAAADELPSGSADLVISNHALEHTLQPLTELRALRRVLRPGGRLVLMLPVDDWRSQRSANPADINHHLYTWTPLLIGNLLSEAGFDILESRVANYGWPGRLTFLLARLLPARLFDAMGAATAVMLKRRELRAIGQRPVD